MVESKGNPLEVVVHTVAQADVDTDANGDVNVVIGELRTVEAAVATIEGGYVAQTMSISGNTATIRIFREKNDGAGATALTPYASATNIAAMTIIAVGRKK